MSVSLEDFLKRLTDSGVLTEVDLEEHFGGLGDDERPTDAAALAERLVAAGKLTAFQAETLVKDGSPGIRLGSYLLVDRIGVGGMGEVYRAVHSRMDRPVAVKILAPHVSVLPQAIDRFQHEVRAAARLHHPHVVHAYDAGQDGDRHFLAMEYVDGSNLSDRIEQHGPLPIDVAVDYVTQAARALAYAHEQGVIHRDVKPSNLLVDREGRVKILDLGIARVMGAEGLTQTGQVMGTVETMAPEQAEEDGHIDARTDVYGLGCTLYLLLTGRSMYPRSTTLSVLQAHRNDPIPSLADVRPDVPRELAALYRKMVAKRPRDRPAGMDQVIDALQSVPKVGDAPPVVVAAADAPRRRKHRRTLVGAGGIVLIAVIAGLWSWKRGASDGPWQPSPVSGARFHVTFTRPADVVHDLAFSSDGSLLAAASADGAVDVYDATTGHRRHRLLGHADVVRSVVFLPDGKTLVSASNDRTIRVWDLGTGRWTSILHGHERRIRGLAVDPNGHWLASTGRDGSLRLWDLATDEQIASADGHTPTGHEANTGVLSLAVHPTGDYLATAGFDRCVCLWKPQPLEVLERMGPHDSDVGYTAFSPDGRLLAYDLDLGKVALVEVPSCKHVHLLPGHNGWVTSLAFSPDSSALATGGEDHQVKLWRVRDGALLDTLEGHDGPISALAFSADGTRLASGSRDTTIRLWEVLR